MKGFAFLALAFFVACSYAFTLSPADSSHILRTSDPTLRINVTCGVGENCTGGSSGWVFTQPTGVSVLSNGAGVEPSITINPSAVTPVPGLFTVTFRAVNSSNIVVASKQVTIVVSDSTVYDSFPGVASAWVATLVLNEPSRNLQWSPKAQSGAAFSAANVPYSFIDIPNPSGPKNRPSDSVPLYWGNFYEIRLGLVSSNTANTYLDGNYCGTNGTWPDTATGGSPNGLDVPPRSSDANWNATNSYGCKPYLEQGDIWTFPAPLQSIANAAGGGYDTVAQQTGANTLTNGPLTWTVRGGAGSSLVFTGLTRPAGWLASCAPADAFNTLPANFPCIAARYNPDPQVWVVSATGAQPARVSAIGAGVTPNNQATPRVSLDILKLTNEFKVSFVWPYIAVDTPSATGVPPQPPVTNVPTCSGTAFVGYNASASVVEGVEYFPTCHQGLGNRRSLLACDNTTFTNCLDDPTAATNGKTVMDGIIGASSGVLGGIWISQRPIQILKNGGTNAVLNAGSGSATSILLPFDAQQGTLPLTISLPLDAGQNGTTGVLIADNYWSFGANGTGSNPGVISVKPKSVFECRNYPGDCLPTGATPNYVAGNIGDFFGGTVPTLTLSNGAPTATLAFSKLPTPSAGKHWIMFFEVTDSATGGPYSSIPYVVIELSNIEVDFINFPPTDGIFYITEPRSVAANSYNYQIRIKRSPQSLGLASINVDFTITGATGAIQIFVGGSQVTSFQFTGYQTVINFQVYTSQTPVGPFAMTFTSSSSFLDLSGLQQSGLYVRPNPISVKTQAGTRVEGPYVGEPFYVEFTWSPPAPAAFTITASGGSLAEGTKTASVSASDTGVILGPITPILPSNVDLATPFFQLPIALSLTGTTSYSLPSIVTVTVFRHTFVVTNAISSAAASAGALTLFTTGERSRPYCITTDYPVFNSSVVGAGDSLSITFAGTSAAKNIPGLIFEPAAVVLSAAATKQCVTIRADRDYNWDSEGGAPFTYAVTAYLGGSLAGMFQNPIGVAGGQKLWDFPHTVTLESLKVHTELDPSKIVSPADANFTYALGETVQLRVWVDVLPSVGLNYTVYAPGVTIVPSVAGSQSTTSHGRFGPAPATGAPAQWQAWDVTFGGFAGDIAAPGSARQLNITIYVSSGDAEFYRSTAPNPLLDAIAIAYTTVNIVKRGVSVGVASSQVAVTSLVGGSTTGTVSLTHPVVNGLTVNITARSTNGASSSGLSFSPSSVVFTPGGPNSQSFSVSGNLLGSYEWSVALAGPDADIFDVNDGFSDWVTTTVTKRAAPVITDLGAENGLVPAAAATIYAGLAYGPVGILFPNPLGLGESVTITPSGSDFTFTPASVTLTAGQSQAMFSFVFNSASGVETAVVFWTVSGPDAWKYSYDASKLRQEYTVLYAGVTVSLQSAQVIPGTTHEGYVTIPFPVTSDLVVTPFVFDGAVTFSPAVWNFSPTSGTTLHFTYTVNSVQAFALSGNTNANQDDSDAPVADKQTLTTASKLTVVYLVNGTDSGVFVAPSPTNFAVIRPKFFMDYTYGKSNVKEQDGTKFVVGKWSTEYSIYLSAAPAAGAPVTLTLSDSQGVLEFLVGESTTPTTSAALVFSADNYVQNLKFRFVKLLSGDGVYYGVSHLSITVSGTNAAWYAYDNIYAGFSGILVVPALAVSPIPAIYTDGAAHGLFVAVKSKDGNIGGAWPYADDAQFTLHIVPDGYTTGVAIEPSTLEFSKSKSGDPVQSFSIIHTYPRVFTTARQYKLKYYLRFAGATTATEITSVIPQDAQTVLLSRYQIIPKFPHVLSYGWQKASFNLSHVPLAHVSFIPRIPPVDGNNNVRGATTPAGRVDFEPPVIVASPGQQVVEFRVKAQPGVDRDNLYYRVDWEVHGHLDDLTNWIEWLQKGANGLNNPSSDQLVFATWHLASASVASISFALVSIACLLALARNMF